MLRTNRQIYEEAREMFYQKNTLKLTAASDDWTNGLAFETLQFTPLSAFSSVRKVDLTFWLNGSVMEMTYYAPNEEKQKLLVLHTRQICNMLSEIPTLHVVTLTASLCFDFVGEVSGGDVKWHDPQLLQYRITAALEPLMSLPQTVTIQRLEHRI